MNILISFTLSFLVALSASCSFAAQAAENGDHSPRVLASVHPLALIAASVVAPENIEVQVPAGMTPHDFSLRPSDIDVIQNADIIVWAGPESEPYLAGFAKRWPDKVWINAAKEGERLYQQDPALIGDEARNDPHWWFSVAVARQLQHRLAEQLDVDPAAFDQSLDQAVQDAHETLAPVRDRGFFVFHRAYDHWVYSMGLNMKGAFTLSPEQKPGLRTLQEMRQQLQRGDVVCVFSEPEFSPAMVDRLVDGVQVGREELDPMAMQIPLSADGYPNLLKDMAERAYRCLSAVDNKAATALDNTVYEGGDDGHHHHHGHAAEEHADDEHAHDEHEHEGHAHEEHSDDEHSEHDHNQDHEDHADEHADEQDEGGFFSRLLK